MPTNPNLQKIIKLTAAQYNTLSSGGSITYQGITYTGLNDNYLYLIQDPYDSLPKLGPIGSITLAEVPDSFAVQGIDDTWVCTRSPYVTLQGNGYKFVAHNATYYVTGTCLASAASSITLSSILSGSASGFTRRSYGDGQDATTSTKGVVRLMTNSEMDAQTGGASSTSVSPIVNLIYPIGAIFMSASTTANPNTLFTGTTWERIEGKFLLGATGNTASTATNVQKNASVGPGGQGGEAAHQLTTDELPSNIGSFTALRWAANTGESGKFTYTQRHSDRTLPTGSDCGDALYTLSGGNTTHNNMPPFLAVCIWKRTA